MKAWLWRQSCDNILQAWGNILQEAADALKSTTNIQFIHFTAKIPRSRYQEVEMGVAPLTIILCNPLAKYLLSGPMTLGSVGLEVLVPKGGMPGDTTVPLNWS